MLHDKLEILLITFNRAQDLDRTLAQVLNSPFAECRLTILDNCSSDDTPLVCAKYQQLFPHFDIIRHKRNIGGVANYLHAVEMSTAEYAWVLCDDDDLDFSDCHDVIEAIESEQFDLISLGAPGQYDWERGLATTSQELMARGARYYFTYSFMPSFIFRTVLYDSECIYKAYMIAGDLYPQFIFLNKSVEQNFAVYASRHKIIARGFHNEASFSEVFWLTSWVNSAASIPNKQVREKVVYQAIEQGTFLRWLIHAFVIDKLRTKRAFQRSIPRNVLSLALGLSAYQRVLLLLALPFALVPAFVYQAVNAPYKRIKRTMHAKPAFVNGIARRS